MRLNRRQLRRLIETAIYEDNNSSDADKAKYGSGPAGRLARAMPAGSKYGIDFKDKKEIISAASALHTAMFGGLIGLGTDEESIRNVFEALNKNEEHLASLKSEYKRIFQSDLMKDLRSEMSGKDIIDYIESAFPGAMS